MTRIEQLRFIFLQKQLEKCEELLTGVGVPEWVENADCKGVPSNSIPSRLKWFLSRRKNVKPSEIDRKLQKEMKYYCEIIKK